MRHAGTQEIETPRLLLRRLMPSDAPMMYANWANDPEVTRWLRWTPHKDVAETQELLSAWALLYPNDTSIATDAIAVDASGNAVGFTVENAKLTKAEKAALNALLQDTAYGSEIKVSYTTDGTTVTNVTYSIPVPDEYKDYENVKVVIKDDAGTLHTVDFKIEKGYIVFTF